MNKPHLGTHIYTIARHGTNLNCAMSTETDVIFVIITFPFIFDLMISDAGYFPG